MTHMTSHFLEIIDLTRLIARYSTNTLFSLLDCHDAGLNAIVGCKTRCAHPLAEKFQFIPPRDLHPRVNLKGRPQSRSTTWQALGICSNHQTASPFAFAREQCLSDTTISLRMAKVVDCGQQSLIKAGLRFPA